MLQYSLTPTDIISLLHLWWPGGNYSMKLVLAQGVRRNHSRWPQRSACCPQISPCLPRGIECFSRSRTVWVFRFLVYQPHVHCTHHLFLDREELNGSKEWMYVCMCVRVSVKGSELLRFVKWTCNAPSASHSKTITGLKHTRAKSKMKTCPCWPENFKCLYPQFGGEGSLWLS